MTRRRGQVTASAVVAACAVSVCGVAVAAPEEASRGVFLYTDATTGLVTSLVAPPELECIVAKGSGAHNLTESDVVLYYDGACQRYLLLLVPGESLNIPFTTLAFFPAGGRGSPPAQLPEPASAAP